MGGIMDFKLECRAMMIKACQKLIEKCPLNYSVVRNLKFLDPRSMSSKPEQAFKGFERVLNVLVDAQHVSPQDCDQLLHLLRTFLDKESKDKKEEFESFEPDELRLDHFLQTMLKSAQYAPLWSVLSKLLILSHGQAAIERGFSVNQQCLADNLGSLSLAARRMICDHICAVGGIGNVQITKEMLLSCRSSYQKYQNYLHEKKMEATEEERAKKRKQAEKERLEQKKLKLSQSLRELEDQLNDLD